MYSSGVRQDLDLDEAQPYAGQIHCYTIKNTKLEFELLFEISKNIILPHITAIYKDLPVRASIAGRVSLQSVRL